jgi:hypothetical protein
MNPPTTVHEVLVNKVKSVAKQVGGSHHIILSHSQDAAKNPLTAAQKVKHAKRFFPDTNISVATKEEPNFLTQAAKLHKQGVTHLHMVAGADRTAEYHKLLHKYNGTHEGALFNFKKITVHNAGERDPDAEGTEGMSASKMRKHAGSGNFDDFKQGIPKHVPEHHAKELFRDVRKGMSIKESIDLNEEFQILLEGVHDQSIFKAIFLAGGPGSGKDYVLDNTLDGQGLTEINSDKALEFLMDKEGLDKMMPVGETEKRDIVRGRAKNITELRQQLALLGRNGLIINGTGDDVVKTKRIKDQLEKLGYDTAMLLVNTRDDISAQRNIERGQRGGRAVPEPIRKEKWDSVQLARTEYAKMFGDNYKEFDNSEDLRQADPETVKAKKSELLQLYTGFKEFVSTPPKSPESQFWVANELDKKDTLPVQTDGAEQLPAAGDAAAEEARSLGLQYYGFGRYGKNGKVTHRSVHGQLVLVNKEEPKQPKIPVSSSSQKPVKPVVKESFSNFIKESVTVSITGDTAEEVNKMFSMMQGVTPKEETQSEQYQFTDTTEVLTLGSRHESVGDRPDSMTFTNDDILIEKHEVMRDKDGKVRIFMLRNSAAKEAHTKNGTIVKYKNGYVVKLNGENKNAKLSEEIIPNQTKRTSFFCESSSGRNRSAGASGRTNTGTSASSSSGRNRSAGASGRTNTGTSASSSTGSCCGTSTCTCDTKHTTEETTRSKITLAEIRTRQKEKVIESINNGESGLSMASSGENLGRDTTRIKTLKKPLEELTGDETTMSIGDQKEGELKRIGINLKTFKSKKVIG